MRSPGHAQQHLLASAGRRQFGQQLRVDGQAGREPGRAEEAHLPNKVLTSNWSGTVSLRYKFGWPFLDPHRLDFISFSIEQPNEQSVCSVDSFQVAGAINKVPVICGDNDGQHSITYN